MSPDAQNESNRSRRGILRRIIKDVGSATPHYRPNVGLAFKNKEYSVRTCPFGIDVSWGAKENAGVIFVDAFGVVTGSTANTSAPSSLETYEEFIHLASLDWVGPLECSSYGSVTANTGGVIDTAVVPRSLIIDYERQISELSAELAQYKGLAADIELAESDDQIVPSAPLNAASVRVLEYIASVRVPNSASTLSDFEEEGS